MPVLPVTKGTGDGDERAAVGSQHCTCPSSSVLELCQSGQMVAVIPLLDPLTDQKAIPLHSV